MSYSKAITEEDLRNILNEVLPLKYPISMINGLDACLLKAENISVPVGTADKVFNPTSSWVLNGSTFSKGTNNRIIVNESCTCIVVIAMVFSAISNTSSIKVVGLGRNSENNELSMSSVGYPTTWTSLSATDVAILHANDELHFTGRCASGTNTLRQANIAVIRIG